VNKEDYILRITRATPVQLVIINHELLIAFIDEALEAFNADSENFKLNINKAKNALTQLIEGLDFKNAIAQDLFTLYIYAGEMLNKAHFSLNFDAAVEVKEMFENLLDGWQQIEHTPDDRIMPQTNSPEVFAGLTYQKDGLTEYIPEDEDRGYKA
jgi:flagellar biosynthetic protein FliS